MSNQNDAMKKFLEAEFSFSKGKIHQKAVAQPSAINRKELMESIICSKKAPCTAKSAQQIKSKGQIEFLVTYLGLSKTTIQELLQYYSSNMGTDLWKGWSLEHKMYPNILNGLNVQIRIFKDIRAKASINLR